MMGLNRVVLVGNLGKDPEMQVLKDGLVVAKISVATTDIFRLPGGNLYKDTQWHTVILWRSLAELAVKYLKKGSHIYLEGRLRTSNYEDKNGKRRYVTEIVGDRFIMLDKRQPGGGSGDIASLLDDPFPL